MCDQLQKSDFSISGVESTSALLNVLVVLNYCQVQTTCSQHEV